jgi:DNA-binding MarR family transcriptional regulator
MKSKAQKTREPADEVFRSLIRTMGLIRQALGPHFDRHEIGRAQFMALATLCQAREQGIGSLTIGELSARMIVRPPSMTGVVHKLHGLGLVEVKKSQADARSRDVSLTQKGWELHESMLDEHAREVGKLMDCLSVSEQKTMLSLLGRMSDHLAGIQNKTDGPAGAKPGRARKSVQELNP